MPDKNGKLTLEEKKIIQGEYRKLFLGSDEGQKVLGYLAIECMESRQTFVPSNADVSAFNEGKRSVILRIRSILNGKIE